MMLVDIEMHHSVHGCASLRLPIVELCTAHLEVAFMLNIIIM